jgi:pyruvate formate lyase activating enzyme
MSKWMQTHAQARLEERLANGDVRCHLSPRNCTIKEGGLGFCKVRGNVNGRLVTFNYGKGVHLTEETVETEAVYHFAPGARILSLGNIGCMLNCGYCHNWKTSQAKHASDSEVYQYTPEEVVNVAKAHGIRILSWTYNDPVVWHEFVRDTSAIARDAGLVNLFKSAFFITEEAVNELLPTIDIFSISIKAIADAYYRHVTTGWLQPVLDATKQVQRAGKHVEISMLMVTDISDSEAHAQKIAEWVLAELGDTVPLHFVRFHPDYRMRNSVRTPIPRLVRAREIAMAAGVKHVYLGNIYDEAYTSSLCHECGKLLVTRFGLTANASGLDDEGHCRNCGADNHFSHIDLDQSDARAQVANLDPTNFKIHSHQWRGDIASVHVQIHNSTDERQSIYHRRRLDGRFTDWTHLEFKPRERYRFILAKGQNDERGVEVAIRPGLESNLHEVFDRAHFPTESISNQVSRTDTTPFPHYEGKQQSYNRIRELVAKEPCA